MLRQSFCFSAALFAGRGFLNASEFGQGAKHFMMIGDWGNHKSDKQQKAVAKGMEGYMKAGGITPEAMFLLGDNFYGPFKGGTKCKRWRTQFSGVYPKKVFPGKCHAILGNHDYDDEPVKKLNAELEYSTARPGTRWNMPGKWYRLDLEQDGKPLMTVLALNSNFKNKRLSLTPEEREEQTAWLKAELAKPRTAPWMVALGHHPMYSNGKYGDSSIVLDEWDEIFRENGVQFYFCGHEHDLQHIEIEGHPTSFVVSGGGGANIRELSSKEHEPFGKAVAGFTHLEVTQERFIVRHVDEEGRTLHGFSKTPDGEWSGLS